MIFSLFRKLLECCFLPGCSFLIPSSNQFLAWEVSGSKLLASSPALHRCLATYCPTADGSLLQDHDNGANPLRPTATSFAKVHVLNSQISYSSGWLATINPKFHTLIPTMDYSASIHDADHPAEASPWGNSPSSSPRHNRTAFASSITSEPPVSPFRYPSQTSNTGLSDEGGFGAGDSDYRRPDTASTVSAGDTTESAEAQSDIPAAAASQEVQSPGFGPGSQGPLSPQAGDSQQSEPTHGGEHAQGSQEQQKQQQQHQQPRRPPQPQFKLQAKITGLERTGRKDPILRFDVHVRVLTHSHPRGKLTHS